MRKAILFDLDDTLFDQRYSFRTALKDVQDYYPHVLGSVSVDEAEMVHLAILNEVHKKVLAGTISMDEARTRRFSQLLAHFGKEVSEEEQLEMRTYLRERYKKARRATKGAIPFLHELRSRGVRIGIVSNNIVEEQMEKLRVCGLLDLIDSITISEEAGISKPDLAIFRISLERLRSTPEETVMIGDSWENDIYPAQSLAMKAIWFNNYGVESRDHSVPTITSFENIPEVLHLILG